MALLFRNLFYTAKTCDRRDGDKKKRTRLAFVTIDSNKLVRGTGQGSPFDLLREIVLWALQ
jgi:hypothetical protein